MTLFELDLTQVDHTIDLQAFYTSKSEREATLMLARRLACMCGRWNGIESTQNCQCQARGLIIHLTLVRSAGDGCLRPRLIHPFKASLTLPFSKDTMTLFMGR